MLRVSMLLAGLVLVAVYLGHAKAQNPSTAHLGSSVIMVRYETPELSGQRRAAIVVDGPFACPAGHPDPAEPCTKACKLRHPAEKDHMECVDLRFFINEQGVDLENLDPVLCDGGATTCGVKTGMDWRKNVVHDPTGNMPRSYHLWGETTAEASE